MSILDAARFLQQNADMSSDAALREITRTSMFPGTGLMYTIGTDTVHDTRREWMNRNPDTPLRVFHDSFLQYGSIPATCVRDRMLKDITP